ncbi:hypothetical protein CVT24_011673 [Panaeolus cyanescens]|uniref:Uncharacterized protein n=1 Tax=Panaeolus cyanescens TaxID=181874 RepID=A0A409YH68_9AGAR|nr:hypothetical protein CVT24_011673 [Panaeolus cyanescens]
MPLVLNLPILTSPGSRAVYEIVDLFRRLYITHPDIWQARGGEITEAMQRFLDAMSDFDEEADSEGGFDWHTLERFASEGMNQLEVVLRFYPDPAHYLSRKLGNTFLEYVQSYLYPDNEVEFEEEYDGEEEGDQEEEVDYCNSFAAEADGYDSDAQSDCSKSSTWSNETARPDGTGPVPRDLNNIFATNVLEFDD